jgi:sugar O-acyltransferase (sialic acid O-acetyltransferase NeuD family)
MEKRIVIFGAGGAGREVLQVIRDINAVLPTWKCEGFIVDSEFQGAPSAGGLPVLGNIDWLAANPDVHVVVAVGASAARWRVVQRIRDRCTNPFPVLIHPRAWIGTNVLLGDGSVICAGAMLTTDIRVGEHVHVNIGSSIAHDAELGDFATLYAGVRLTGNVHLHDGVEAGTGSVVIPRCEVGRWSIIGAGAVVTGRVGENCTVVGVPARVVKQRPEGWYQA